MVLPQLREPELSWPNFMQLKEVRKADASGRPPSELGQEWQECCDVRRLSLSFRTVPAGLAHWHGWLAGQERGREAATGVVDVHSVQ